jgi:tripartite-type tricarboxylate transporter receptor subunit TctC
LQLGESKLFCRSRQATARNLVVRNNTTRFLGLDEHAPAGTLRPVAVAGSKRIGSLPDVPAISETIESVNLQGWFMLMAPAGTPTDIIQKLSSEIARALNSPEVQERAPTLGFDVDVGDGVTPAGAKRFLETELTATRKIIQGLGIEPE